MRDFILFLFLFTFSIPASFSQKECASYSYYLQESTDNLSLNKANQNIESFINNRLINDRNRMSPPGASGSGLALISIPVIVHILYNNSEQKISEDQVRSQIDALNKDFRKSNSEASTLPVHFKSLAADCFIEFALATIDPQGKPTKGIIWKRTSTSSFGTDDRIKFSRHGGDDAWDSDKYLNIWVGKLTGGTVGYSSPLGSAKEKDGIVIRYTAFGTMGTIVAPYHLGRTTVHEAGHWLGLKHIWGDRYCGDDQIADTPPQKGPTQGCPRGISASCDNAASGSMYMNYMDITHDACTSLFTLGQRDRMRTLFSDGGPRYSLLHAVGSSGPSSSLPVELPVDTPAIQMIRVFPNPAVNMITVHTAGTGSGLITIHNHLGQTVMQQKIISGTMQLHIGALKNGLYFIKIGKRNKAQKFVKGG
jgi:hypothetical protein